MEDSNGEALEVAAEQTPVESLDPAPDNEPTPTDNKNDEVKETEEVATAMPEAVMANDTPSAAIEVSIGTIEITTPFKTPQALVLFID